MRARLALLLAAGWLLACASPSALLRPGEGFVPAQLRERQIIVALRLVTPAVLADRARRLARFHDLKMVMGFPLASIGLQCAVFEVPEGRGIDAVIDEVAADPDVRLVQRNRRFEGQVSGHSDPYASLQHGAAAVRADAAHRWATGRGVRVAIVDTGIDVAHPDLVGRVAETRSFVQGGRASFEQDEHGTAVAGIIAAGADDGVGIYGVAPEVALLAAKACWHDPARGDAASCSSWTIARAIDFAIEAGAQVLNLSLAGPPDPLLARLLDAADAAGMVAVAPGEAEADRAGFPASHPSVIAVVASDASGGFDPPSWAGRTPALAAPGEEILTTVPGERYQHLSGSSLATAHVTGAIALLLEKDPELPVSEVARLLHASARQAPAPATMGALDACAALRELTSGLACP